MGIVLPEAQKQATQEKAAHIDLLTVAAIAVVTALLDSITHEGLGHGLTALLLGLHPRYISTVALDVSYAGFPAWKGRVVDAAGCGSQILMALLILGLMRWTPKTNATTRYFLWLFSTTNLIIAGGYLLVPTFLGFGDWESFVHDLPSPLAWKIGLELFGLCISLLGLYLGARNLDPFVGRATIGAETRFRRYQKLVYTPYLVIGTVATLASIFNPAGALLILVSGVAASFGGNGFMLGMLFFARKSFSTTPETVITPTRNWLWLWLGLLALFIEFFVLGPGLPR